MFINITTCGSFSKDQDYTGVHRRMKAMSA